MILSVYFFVLHGGSRLFIEWREGDQIKRATIDANGQTRSYS